MTDAEHADVLARMVQVGMPEDEQAAIDRAIEKLLEPEPDWYGIDYKTERKIEQLINKHLDKFDTPRLASDIMAALR